MLNSKVTKVVFVLLIAVLVQAFMFVSTSVINTALASGDGSDSGGGSDDDSNDWGHDLGVALTPSGPKTQLPNGYSTPTNAKGEIFPSGNIGITVNNNAYSPLGESGGTVFYANGDGTYNTITYPPSGSESNGCGGANCGSSDDDSGTPYCPPGSWMDRNGTCTSGCPAGSTLISGSCCPNQNIITTTTGSGKGQSTTQSCSVPPPVPPTATISQSKATTITGEAFTISYGRSGGGDATSCVLQRQSSTINSNGGAVSSWNENLGTVGNYTYRTQCYGPGGSSAWASVDHAVIVPPPTVSLTADQYIVPYNTGTNLNWTSQNAVACTASGAWSGSKAISGTEGTGNLTSLTTYFLQCRNSANNSTSPAVVNINIRYGTGSEIDVTPKVVRKNETVTVTWNTGTSVPANCQIETGAIVLQSPLTTTTGSLTHVVTGETTFTINCEGNRNTADVTVKVLPEFQET